MTARDVIAKALRDNTRVQMSLHCADAILAALDAAGYAVVPKSLLAKVPNDPPMSGLQQQVRDLVAERDRLKAVLKPRLNAKAIEGLQEILEAMEAMDEREAPFLKTLLDWHEASRKALAGETT